MNINIILENKITKEIGKRIFIGLVSEVAVYFGSKKIIELIEKNKKEVNVVNTEGCAELG